MPSWLRDIAIGVVLTGLLVGAVLLARQIKPQLPATDLLSARSKGPSDAKVKVIEYSDFQCPACKTAQMTINGILALHQEKIRFTFQHFPLEGHRWSRISHQAAECAAKQSRFWDYHDRLYGDQEIWSKGVQPPVETFIQYAGEMGLDLNEFARCLSDVEVAKTIQAERMGGLDLGVRSTPSFFVNGEMVAGVTGLREKIERVLAQ